MAGASTLNRIVDLSLYAHDDWFGCTKTSLAAAVPLDSASFDGITSHWVTRLLGPDGTDRMAELASLIEVEDRSEPLDMSDEDAQGLATAVIAFVALTPEFLQR